MEPHKTSVTKAKYDPANAKDQYEYFDLGRQFMYENYREEESVLRSKSFDTLSVDDFFREYIWVVHATGFSAKAVGGMINKLFSAYGSIDQCSSRSCDETLSAVLPICNNPQKARAIHKTAELLGHMISQGGWQETKKKMLSSTDSLQELPYVGAVTCYHLSRNIGNLESVKPDLHLIRMAKYWQYEDPLVMCKDLQEQHQKDKGEYIPLGIVDLTLWYMASTFGTLTMRQEGDR